MEHGKYWRRRRFRAGGAEGEDNGAGVGHGDRLSHRAEERGHRYGTGTGTGGGGSVQESSPHK